MQSVMGMHDPVAKNFIVAMNYQKGEFFVQQTSFECLHSIDSGVQQTLRSSLGASTWSDMTWEKLLIRRWIEHINLILLPPWNYNSDIKKKKKKKETAKTWKHKDGDNKNKFLEAGKQILQTNLEELRKLNSIAKA